MKYLTLDYIKQHSRLNYDCEDNLLELYGTAAEDSLLNVLNRTYEDLIEEYGCVPAPLMQATLMLVDTSYQYRSPSTNGSVTQLPTFDFFVKPYMNLADNKNSYQYGCKNL